MRAAALSIYRYPKNKHCFANEFTNGMRASVPIILLSLIFASGHCCSVVISQPLHLSATVSPEFSIAVAQPSNLSVSIDGSYIFNESVSGNIKFALQARLPLPTTSNYAISNFFISGTLAWNACLERDSQLLWCTRPDLRNLHLLTHFCRGH